MGQHGPYLRRLQGGYAHWCPACKELHALMVERAQANGARWSFNDNPMAPGFSPSVNITSFEEDGAIAFRCHYTLTRGSIRYHGDSTHQMRGMEVKLPELPVQLRDATNPLLRQPKVPKRTSRT